MPRDQLLCLPRGARAVVEQVRAVGVLRVDGVELRLQPGRFDAELDRAGFLLDLLTRLAEALEGASDDVPAGLLAHALDAHDSRFAGLAGQQLLARHPGSPQAERLTQLWANGKAWQRHLATQSRAAHAGHPQVGRLEVVPGEPGQVAVVEVGRVAVVEEEE